MRSNFTPDIRPEFLHQILHDLPSNLRPPHRKGIENRAVLRRAVSVRDPCGDGIAADSRDVELTFAGVAARNKAATYRVARAVEESAFAQLVVARVLVK